MSPRIRFALAGLFVALMPLVFQGVAQAQEFRAGNIEVRQAWSRATPQGAKVAAGYLAITNHGNVPDRLIAVSTNISGKAEVHEMAMKDGVATMRPIAGGIAIAPGETVTLKPGGLHLMFLDVGKPLKQGEKFTASLQFEKAGKLDVSFDVQAVGAPAPAGHGHPM